MSNVAHLYRIVQDQKTGKMLSGVQVAFYAPGTTTAIADTLYSDEALTQALPNPFIADSGVIDVYLPNPQNIALQTTYGTATNYIDELPVLPDAAHIVVTPVPFTIQNGPGTNTFLSGIDAATAQWVSMDDLYLAKQAAVIGWCLSGAFSIDDCTRDANGAVETANISWPDGTTGIYTADTISAVFPGKVDAYHVTYGDPIIWTLTQTDVTRDSNGNITVQPVIQVA